MALCWIKVLLCDDEAGMFLFFFMLFFILYNIYVVIVYYSFSVISSYIEKNNLFVEGLFLIALLGPFIIILL